MLLILFMFIICMCSLIFQTNRLSTEHPMFAPSDRGVGWSRGGRALRYVGSRMAYSNPRKDRNVYQGCFKLCMHNICVPYLYYIMYLYVFFNLFQASHISSFGAKKNLPTWFSVRWKQYTLLGRLWVGSFHCGMDVGRFVHGADSRSIPSAIMCHLRVK